MAEDQKNPTVTRNYIGSHKQRRVIDYESLDEPDDSFIDLYDSDEKIELTGEIKGKSPIQFVQKKKEVPLAH